MIILLNEHERILLEIYSFLFGCCLLGVKCLQEYPSYRMVKSAIDNFLDLCASVNSTENVSVSLLLWHPIKHTCSITWMFVVLCVLAS